MNAELTGRENIMLRGLYNGMPRDALAQLEDGVTAFAGLSDFIDLPVRIYSTGMVVRRFRLATAIRPQILLMDEWILAGDAEFLDRAKLRLETMVRGAEILVLSTPRCGRSSAPGAHACCGSTTAGSAPTGRRTKVLGSISAISWNRWPKRQRRSASGQSGEQRKARGFAPGTPAKGMALRTSLGVVGREGGGGGDVLTGGQNVRQRGRPPPVQPLQADGLQRLRLCWGAGGQSPLTGFQGRGAPCCAGDAAVSLSRSNQGGRGCAGAAAWAQCCSRRD